MFSPINTPLDHNFGEYDEEFTLDDFERALDQVDEVQRPVATKRKFATVPPINIELALYEDHTPTLRPQVVTPKVSNNSELYALLTKQNTLIQKLMEEIEEIKEEAKIKEDRIVTLFYNYRHRIVKLEELVTTVHKR